MFEAAELGQKLSKAEYEASLPELREQLLDAQFALRDTKTTAIIVIGGLDAAGKGEVVNRLTQWLDTKLIETHSYWFMTEEEYDRPWFWRFWRTLPSRGRMGILFGAWYAGPIIRRAYDKISTADFDEQLRRIAFFEKMLVDDHALIIKFWLHLSKSAQKKWLQKLEKKAETRRRVSKTDWKNHDLYDEFIGAAERAIRQTDTGHAPWHLIESVDSRFRDLTTARIILESLRRYLNDNSNATPKTTKTPPLAAVLPATNSATILNNIDLSRKLPDAAYDEKLQSYQSTLNRLVWEAHKKKVSTVVVFEGWDAAGKGGSIRRMTEAMDSRLYRVIAIGPPTDEERAQHYLWRFWRHIPRPGKVTIYDRSWYGRVLVERVEGFATEPEWMRAYLEINDFEEQLSDFGIVLTKFWIHISAEEQLQRFTAREQIPYKRYKISDEDWRNREKWDAYVLAVNDMVARTSTSFAPWTLIAGNDKKFARIQVLETFCERLEKAL